MCVSSMVADHYRDKIHDMYPGLFNPPVWQSAPAISREEFDALKRDIEEMKALLKRANEYDARNNEPHCEMDEKVALLKQIAKLVGVDLSDVFPAAE